MTEEKVDFYEFMKLHKQHVESTNSNLYKLTDVVNNFKLRKFLAYWEDIEIDNFDLHKQDVVYNIDDVGYEYYVSLLFGDVIVDEKLAINDLQLTSSEFDTFYRYSIVHGLIYPDGTINGKVKEYLNLLVMKELFTED